MKVRWLCDGSWRPDSFQSQSDFKLHPLIYHVYELLCMELSLGKHSADEVIK